jgi:hypothetical protein
MTMMISQAVLLLAFSGVLNTTGPNRFTAEQARQEFLAERASQFPGNFKYSMGIIEPSPGRQYHMPSVSPDPSKDYKIHVVDPDGRMGRSDMSVPGVPDGKFKEGK